MFELSFSTTTFVLECDNGSVVRCGRCLRSCCSRERSSAAGRGGLDEEDFVRFVQGRDAYGSSPELMDVLRLVMSLSLDDE